MCLLVSVGGNGCRQVRSHLVAVFASRATTSLSRADICLDEWRSLFGAALKLGHCLGSFVAQARQLLPRFLVLTTARFELC